MNVLLWGIDDKVNDILGGGLKQGCVIGYVESDPKQIVYNDKPVYSPQSIPVEYDWLFVIDSNSERVLELISEHNIPLEKVGFLNIPKKPLIDIADNFDKCACFLDDCFLINVPGYEENEEYNFIKKDLKKYNELTPRTTMVYDEKYNKFCYSDKYAQAGEVRNYFWQDLWAARLIYQNNPVKHYDIGSRIDGFIAHLLTFRKDIVLIDVRPMEEKIPGVNFIQADATNLNGIEDNSIESLSALCSLEHFGLGRYGDEIDPEGCFKAFEAIQRKIAPGGMVYISVPVGIEHVEFNAHRVFYAETIVKAFSQMELVRFDAADTNKLRYDLSIHEFDNRNESGCRAYGLFQFKKKTN